MNGTAQREGLGDWRSYDEVAETYERVHAPRTALPARDLVALAGGLPTGRALDVGTGTGVTAQVTLEEAGTGSVVVGVDPSLPMLRVARRIRPELRLAAAEALDLPFRDATFDLLTANFVISHFSRYETALFDMVRVLRRKGRMAVSAWGPGEDEFQRTWRELLEATVGQDLVRDASRRGAPWEERFSDPGRLEESLREAGLREVRVETREYRFQVPREDYVTARETAGLGRFVRQMLGPRGWESFGRRARQVFAERFPDPMTDFREALLAVGTKP